MTERIRPRALATLDQPVRQLDRAPLVVDRVDAAEVADEELSPRGVTDRIRMTGRSLRTITSARYMPPASQVRPPFRRFGAVRIPA
jgi:hypothetical protein